jgi:hypothetical protein
MRKTASSLAIRSPATQSAIGDRACGLHRETALRRGYRIPPLMRID